MSVKNGAVRVTVKDIQDALGQLNSAFSELKAPADAVAKPLEKFSNALGKLQTVASSFRNINFSSSDIEKAIPTISDDLKNKIKDFVDSINGAVNKDSLTKFQNISKSLRSFTLSIKEIMDFKDITFPDNSSVKQSFFKFINEFVPSDNAEYTTLNENIEKMKKVVSSVQKYVNTIKSLNNIKLDLNDDGFDKRWESSRDALVNFIRSFDTIAPGVQHDRMDSLVKSVRKFYSLMRGLDNYKPNTGNWTVVKSLFSNFVTTFDAVAPGIKHDRMDALIKSVRRFFTLMKGLDKYSPTSTNWTTVRDAFTGFITDFNTVAPTIQHDKMDSLIKSVRKFLTLMRGLDKYVPKSSVWTSIRDAFTGFITDFNATAPNIQHDKMDALVKSVRKFFTLLKGLDKYTPNLTNWITVRDEFTKFISGFVPTDPAIVTQLNNGITMVEKVSSVLKKYVAISKSIISFGTVDWATLGTGFKNFIATIATVVSDPCIAGISNKSIQHFSKISSSLKGIASLINSVSGKSFANLKQNLNSAITEIEQFINKMAALAKLPSFSDFERVSKAVGNFRGKLNGVTDAVKRSSGALNSFRSNLRQIYTALVGGSFIYSIIRTIKTAIKEMYNLEYAMARVNTIARVDNETLKQMTHAVQELSATYGVESSKVSKALYDINSATIKGAASMKILEQSMVLAVAGFTDVEKVSDLIAKAVNAYEYNVNEASKISDILFVTVERGINPMEELSEYFGRLFTVSANAGVKLEEIAAGLATLTARGYQTNVASTALNSAILKLSTGTKELNKLFQEYGYASSASALRTMGLTGALQVLYEATGGATNKLHELGFNYRDIRAATTLASGAIDEYTKTLELMNDETYKNGLTSEAFAKVQDTVKFKFDQLKASITVMIQTISEYIDENILLKKTLDYISKGFDDVTKAMQNMQLSGMDVLNAGLVMLVPKIIATYASFKLFSPLLKKFPAMFISIEHAIKGNHKAATMLTHGFISGFKQIKIAALGLYSSFVVIQGVLENIFRLFKIFKEGTFWSGWADFLGLDSLVKLFNGDFLGALKGYFQTWLGDIAGMFGSFIDALSGFTLTDFGSQWRNYFKPADYRDIDAKYHDEQYRRLIEIAQPIMNKSFEEIASTIKSSALNENIAKDIVDAFLHNIALTSVRKEVNKATEQLRAFRYSQENYSEERIQELYEKVRTPVVEYAESLGLSSDEIKSLTKRIDDVRDSVESLNKEFKELQPNMQALNDVFEESRKRISDSFEKFAGPIQKLSQKIGITEEGISVLSKKLGLSIEEAESYFSNPINFSEFEKKLREGIAFYAEGINDKLADVIKKSSIDIDKEIDINSIIFEKLNSYFGSLKTSADNRYIHQAYENFMNRPREGYVNLGGHQSYGAVPMDKIIELAMTDVEFRNELFKYSNMQGTGLSGFSKIYELISDEANLFNEVKKSRIESSFNAISDTLLNSGVLDEEKIKLFNKEKESLRKIFESRYAEFENNPDAFVDIIVSRLNIVDKEIRKAMQDVAGSFQEAKKASVDFTKQMVSFGATVNKLASQKYSIKDVLENNLKLPEVEFFKKQIQQNLRVSDFNLLEPYLETVVNQMKAGVSNTEIKKDFADELRKQHIIDPVMKDVDAVALAGTILDPIINMFKLTDEFTKKFKEIDFIKFINELDYGTELSGFEKYRKVGKSMIDALKSEMIETRQGPQSFETLFSEFRRDLESGMSFKDAQKAFASNYGPDAFNIFYENFKQYQNLVKEFVTKVSEADFTKLLNKMQFGSEMNAFKQYMTVDRAKIVDIMQRQLVEGLDLTFEEAFTELTENSKIMGVTAARQALKKKYGDKGDAVLNQVDNLTKEFESVWSGSSYSLMQSNKNLKKKIHTFLKNFSDAFLTPIQQFDKTQSRLKKQLAVIKKQAEQGVVNPLRIERALEEIEKLQKLNEETMQIKVPSAITASEAVKVGSKEAFDLVATNVFRDMYKVNVQQKNLQDKLVKQAEKLNQYLTDSNNTLRIVTAP